MANPEIDNYIIAPTPSSAPTSWGILTDKELVIHWCAMRALSQIMAHQAWNQDRTAPYKLDGASLLQVDAFRSLYWDEIYRRGLIDEATAKLKDDAPQIEYLDLS